MKKSGLFILLMFGVFASCKKENINAQLGIPLVDVDQYVLLSNPSNISLNSVGGWTYVDDGSRGIVVYHRAFDEYVAFDRHCTWQTTDACGIVSVDSTNIFMGCACCDSRFSLIDGSVINGPAINPLLQYQALLSGPGILHVFN
jgi:nitrite reductase/ring-hydroxylating ferredoxin subunit